MTSQPISQVRAFTRADPVWTAGDAGPLWRLTHGVLRLDRPLSALHADAGSLVQLALPGDLVGLESLCAEPYRLNAHAFTSVRLEAVDTTSPAEREQCLQQAVMQLQRRSLDMTALRTGPVPERVAQLMCLLGHENHLGAGGSVAMGDAIRATLPRLRELADVVDAKPETVCRALSVLLPARGGRRGPVGAFKQAQRQLSVAQRHALEIASACSIGASARALQLNFDSLQTLNSLQPT